MARKDFSTPEYKKKRRIRFIIKCLLMTLLLGAFVYAMNQPYFFINSVQIQGQQSIDEEHLHQEVELYLSEYWLGIIPRKNIFFLGQATLRSHLITIYPKIYHLDIDINIDALTLNIEERKAHSLWCIDREYESVFNEECYFADQRGFWYARAPYFSDNVFLKVYLSPNIERISLGDRYMHGDAFANLFTFIESLEKEYNLGVQKIIFKEQQDISLYISHLENIVFKEKPIILLNMNDSYDTSIRNIGVVLKQPGFARDFQEDAQQLKRIDIRFNDRIFYLFED